MIWGVGDLREVGHGALLGLFGDDSSGIRRVAYGDLCRFLDMGQVVANKVSFRWQRTSLTFFSL